MLSSAHVHSVPRRFTVPHAKKAKIRFKDRRAYSLAEVAGLTGLAISTLYKLMASGRLKTTKIAGRRVVTAEAFEELLAGE
jgi:hypothetical protein